jgi:hypothetical protein
VTAKRARCYGRTAAELVVTTVVDREEWVQVGGSAEHNSVIYDMYHMGHAGPMWLRQSQQYRVRSYVVVTSPSPFDTASA